jgi:hypothetical protein
MVNVQDFLAAILGHWVSLMSGGIVIVALLLWERFRKNAPRIVWVIIVCLFLGVASFQAWNDEHTNVTKADGTIRDLTRQLSE